MKNSDLTISSCRDARAVTSISSESDICIVISQGGHVQGYTLTGSTGFTCLIGDKLGPVLGARATMYLCDCGFAEPNLIWLLTGRPEPCWICHIPGWISRVSKCSPNVEAVGTAVTLSISGLMTSGIINSAIRCFLSLLAKRLAGYSYPRCVNLSSATFMSGYISMQWCTILEILHVTQPGSSSLHSWPSSDSSSSLSATSPSSLSPELARSLTLSLISISNTSE